MPPVDTLAQPALWPLSLIVFLPAAVAAFLSLPIIPRAREELIRWITLATTAVVFFETLEATLAPRRSSASRAAERGMLSSVPVRTKV